MENKREWKKDLVWRLVNAFIRGRNTEKSKPAKPLFPALWLWQQHDDNKISQFGSRLSSSHTLNVTLENQIAPIKSNQTDCRTAINSKDNDKGSRPRVSLPQLVSHCTVDAEDGWKKNKLSCREEREWKEAIKQRKAGGRNKKKWEEAIYTTSVWEEWEWERGKIKGKRWRKKR